MLQPVYICQSAADCLIKTHIQEVSMSMMLIILGGLVAVLFLARLSSVIRRKISKR